MFPNKIEIRKKKIINTHQQKYDKYPPNYQSPNGNRKGNDKDVKFGVRVKQRQERSNTCWEGCPLLYKFFHFNLS